MPMIPFPRQATAAKPPSPPKHFARPEREVWRAVVSQRDFSQSAPRAALTLALDAMARARRCREQIDRDGATIVDRFGCQKAHPLAAVELTAIAAAHRGLKLLGLLDT